MASIMDTTILPEQLKCPICDEVPLDKIYQCENGHTFCDICEVSIGNTCPQCRVKLERKRIRNLALEGLLDSMDLKLDCPFKKHGCTEKVERKLMDDHKENCQFGGNVHAPNEIKWIAKKNGKAPKYAFFAGIDSGKPVFVIRASHTGTFFRNEGVITGQLKLGDKHGYVTYGLGAEGVIAKSNYEVLTCPDGMLSWVASSHGRHHENAVKGGNDPNGDTYYIARVTVNGVSVIGKIHPCYKLCYVPLNGKVVEFSEYEILVRNN